MKKIIFVLIAFAAFSQFFYAEKKQGTAIPIPPRREKVESETKILEKPDFDITLKTSVDSDIFNENQSPFYKPERRFEIESHSRRSQDPMRSQDYDFSAELRFKFK